ncbi:unnamed protein product [Chrysoparadoxa australica]
MGRDSRDKRSKRSRSRSRERRRSRSHSRDRDTKKRRRRSRSRDSRERGSRRERDRDRDRGDRRRDDRGHGSSSSSKNKPQGVLGDLAASISARVAAQESASAEQALGAGGSGSVVGQVVGGGAAAAAGKAEGLTDAQRKRKERLRLWQEQQGKNDAGKKDKDKDEDEAGAEADAKIKAEKAVVSMGVKSKPLGLGLGRLKGTGKGKGKAPAAKVSAWDMDDDDDEKDEGDGEKASNGMGRPHKLPSLGLGGSKFEPPEVAAKAALGSSGGGGGGDVDPLDAFMTDLTSTEELVAQDPMAAAFGGGDGRMDEGRGGRILNTPHVKHEDASPISLDAYAGNTISLEDIIKGQKHTEGWESDANSSPREEEEAESEAEEETEQQRKDREEFMNALRKRSHEVGKLVTAIKEEDVAVPNKKEKETFGRLWNSEGDVMEEGERETEEQNVLQMLAEQAKKKELKPVDHSQIDYISFRKNLYIVPQALAKLPAEQITERRKELEIKIRGKGCPPPVDSWEQCGLSDRLLAIIRKRNLTSPFPIQAQAVPAIMSGRDVIGVARTGSGKTLAFLLPLFRHILDQPPLGDGEGPIGLIMAPARELAVQIYSEAKKFTKALGLRVTAVYGGAGVADQIADLKRGADIVVCTPGRMIDILTMQAGKMVSLARCSYVVMDEADRMFDMGFEPQIQMIIQNIRKDRQTVLFSATFPQKVEQLARKVLHLPLEIVIGGRSIASSAITQLVEVHDEDDKYMRLLQLLGVWFERGNVLVFVDTQQKCDTIFTDLTKSGYPALSLHGGKDQSDRDFTISDFKQKVRTLMVATSVAGRGLDVPDLVCVINYSCPNHLEDYVHRVGRTGRAGRSGTAYTFISPDEEQFSPILVKALTEANQTIPAELQTMSEEFKAKVAKGDAKWARSGFSGKGFTFDESEKTEAQKIRDLEKRQYEIEHGLVDLEDEKEEIEESTVDEEASSKDETASDRAKAAAMAIGAKIGGGTEVLSLLFLLFLLLLLPCAAVVPQPKGPVKASVAVHQARMLTACSVILSGGPKEGQKTNADGTRHFETTLEINDYPQQARWKVSQKSTINQVIELTGVAIIAKGIYIPGGKKPPPGESKLHLIIESPNERDLQRAKTEIQRILNEETLRVGLGGGGAGSKSGGKYSVI